MKLMKLLLAVVTTSSILSSAPSFAQGVTQKYESRPAPGATIENEAEANQHAPGLAQELAPDTKQTATGGPSGGFGRGGSGG